MPLIIFKKKRIVEILASLFDVDLYREQTVLSVHGETDKTFIDSSDNPIFASVFGNARQGIVTPVAESLGSMRINGVTDYITFPYSSAFNFFGNFTVEAWIRPDATISASTYIIVKGLYGSNHDFSILLTSSTMRVMTSGSGVQFSANTAPWSGGVWYHIAVSHNNGVTSLFRDGQLLASQNMSYSNVNQSTPIAVGRAGTTSAEAPFNGLISGLHITKSAKYSASFTPGAVIKDANTVLLLKNENTGINRNNQTIIDSSSNNVSVTRFGDVTQGSFSPFADTGGSAYFDGTGDYLTAPGSDLFSFGTGDFTIETFVNLDSLPTQAPIFDNRANGSAPGLALFILTNGKLGGWGNNVGIGSLGGSGAVPVGKWSHIAVSRQSGVFRFFINGVLDQTVTAPYSVVSSTVIIGKHVDSSTLYFKGSMSNYRVTKGVALYTSNFTVPSTPLASDANTSLLLKFESAGITDSTRNTNIRLFGNAALAANGKFGSSVYFPDTGDYASTINGMPAIGTNDFTIEGWLNPTSLPHTTYVASVIDTQVALNDAGILIARRSAASGNTNQLSVYQGGTWWLTSTSTIPLNQWTHFAVTRHAGTMSIYINGVREASVAHTASILVSSTTRIGNQIFNLGGSFRGYIDDLRITVGKARYQSNFVPMLSEFKDVKPTDFDPYWDKVVLRMTMDGVDNGTTFTDLTGKTVTRVGDTKTVAAEKKFGTASAYFDGNSDYLTVGSSTDFGFGTGDFTVECFVKFTTVTAHQILFDVRSSVAPIGLALSLHADSRFAVYDGPSTVEYKSRAVAEINKWYHVAISRSNNRLRMFIDGVNDLEVTSTTNMGTEQPIRIGGWIGGASYGFIGYIDDLRITKGVARYTTNFVPPAAALPVSDAVVTDQDPYWNETVLAMPMNGIDNGTAFLDFKGNTINLYGNAVTKTSVKKFGTASAYFDGSGAGLVINNPNTAIGAITGDYTIECWVNWSTIPTGNSSGAEKQIIGQHNWPETTAGNWWALFGVNTGLQYYTAGGGSFQKLDGAFTWAQNTWYHVAVSRVGTTVRLFVNGELVGSGVSDKSIIVDNSRPLTIGSDVGGDHNRMHGYIDDLRITRGKARYTTNFTVPALPNPTTGPTF